MAYLSAIALSSLADPLKAGRIVLIASQPHSGSTYFLLSKFGVDADALVVNVDERSDGARICETVCRELGLGAPANTQLDAILANRSGVRRQVLFLNLHRATPAVQEWLLRALLDGLWGGVGEHHRVLVDWSGDPDELLFRAFPTGHSRAPHVVVADGLATQDRVVVAEELVRGAGKPYTWIAPVLADRTGGDVLLMRAILSRLSGHKITTRALQEAEEHAVAKSNASDELGKRVGALAGGDPRIRSIAEQMCKGGSIYGVAPETTSDAAMRALYFAGALAFAPDADTYSIRSPLAAAILGKALELTAAAPPWAYHATAAAFTPLAATVESQLRFRLAGLAPDVLAKTLDDVTAETGNKPLGKRIRDCAVKKGVAGDALKALSEVVAESCPERQSLRQMAGQRAQRADLSDVDAIARLTFTEAAKAGNAAGILDADLAASVLRIASLRNDLSHLRAVSVDECDELRTRVASVLPRLAGVVDK